MEDYVFSLSIYEHNYFSSIKTIISLKYDIYCKYDTYYTYFHLLYHYINYSQVYKQLLLSV